MLSEYLEFRGFAVAGASDGAEALRMAFTRTPAVVLMDLTMPGLDGWEATRRLKADPRTKDVIVIAVTANALAPEEGNARAAGADAFLVKPYDLAVLGDAIDKLITHGRPALNGLFSATGRGSSSRQATTSRRSLVRR